MIVFVLLNDVRKSLTKHARQINVDFAIRLTFVFPFLSSLTHPVEKSLPVLAALQSAAAADRAAVAAAAIAAVAADYHHASGDTPRNDNVDLHLVKGHHVNKRTTNKNQGEFSTHDSLSHF